MNTITITMLWLVSLAAPQQASAALVPDPDPDHDPMAVLRPLEGHWEGAIDGSLGTGRGVREYEWILENQYLLFRHDSVRMPQEKTPEGDHHRELSVFSYDSERQKIVLREFMVEGVVTRYGCDLEGQRLTCVTEHVESGPGIKGVLTLDVESPYAFNERFELSFPGDASPSVTMTNKWTRTSVLK